MIIQHVVRLYFRFPLSYRDIEDLLAERGIDVSYETVRRWALKFGQAYARRLRTTRPRLPNRTGAAANRRSAGQVARRVLHPELARVLDMSDPHVATRYTLAHLARRWLDLHEEIKVHGAQLKVLTKTADPKMLEQFGVGFDTAAEVLIAAEDNTDRIRSEAAFAKLCGVLPDPGWLRQD